MLRKYTNLIVIMILGWVLIISLIVSHQESTTMDEQAHIPSAYTYVRYQDMRLNPEHPPLLKDLAGIPLLFVNPKFPVEDKGWTEGINDQWNLGNKFIHSNDADAITFWSRVPIILLALLLGFFIFKWTKELAGTIAGLFALVLYAFDPNVLGHNHYVTTDLGIAAFIFFAFYYFIKFIKNPAWKNVILSGIFLALAELAKFSAVLLFPLFGLILVIYVLSKEKPDFDLRGNFKFKWAKLWEYIGKYAIIVAICFLLIWILYFFNTLHEPAGKIQDIAKTVFGDEGMGKISKVIVITMSQLPLLKGLSEYFLGVFMVFARVEGGNTFYFLGQVSNQANPWYFPFVFIAKETIPFLMLILFSLSYAIFQTIKAITAKEGSIFKKIWATIAYYLQTSVVQYLMMGFIILYAYLSITGNLNIGLRHLFPILPLAYVLVAKKTFEFLKNIKTGHSKKLFGIIIAIFVFWIILEPIIFFPSYLSYFNETVGGPKNGYKYVTDSNYDWGQDLKRLRNWINNYNECNESGKMLGGIPPSFEQIKCKEFINLAYLTKINAIDKIRIDYFGGSNPAYYFGDKFIPWHAGLDSERGWYAISATFLQESLHKQKNPASTAGGPGDKSYNWLLNYEPVARVGDSIFVYYIP